MGDEHRLIGPLQAMTDDAFAMDVDPRRLRQLLTRLRTRLISHLALRKPTRCPLVDQIMRQREPSALASLLNGPDHPATAQPDCHQGRPHPGRSATPPHSTLPSTPASPGSNSSPPRPAGT